MSCYRTTQLSTIDASVDPRPELPLVIDDFTLALRLGITCKGLWWRIKYKRALYKTFTIPKANGKARIIMNPADPLKCVQRRIDALFLKPLPLLDCVGAYVVGKSCLDSAKRHVNHDVRIGMDLKNFFPSHSRARVRHYFIQYAGYNHFVASLLADLCTAHMGKRHAVPQGSPLSPSLCNLIAQETLDKPLLKTLESTGWVYTRYSDDLTLSHPDLKTSQYTITDIVTLVTQHALAAGYRINKRKLKVQKRHHRQEMLGIVINEHPNINRQTYRRYRAILTNCIRDGFEVNALRYGWDPPETFIDHLQGKCSYFNSVNVSKAQQLLTLLNKAKQKYASIADTTNTV